MSSRYVIGIDIGGNAMAKLDELTKGTAGLMAQLQSLNEGTSKLGQGMDELNKTERGRGLMEAAEKFSAVAETVEHAAHKMIEVTSEVMGHVIKDAMTFQDAQSDMQFAFGEGWQKQYDKLLETSSHLTFKFSEVLGLATGLGRLGIDPFGGKETEFKSKTGQMIDTFTAIQDVTLATNRDVGSVQRSIMEAMAGNFRGLKMSLMTPVEVLDKIKKGIAGASDQQSKYNAIIKEFAAFYGGAGQMKSGNLSFQLLQVKDIMEQLGGKFGKDALTPITAGVTHFVEALNDLNHDKETLKAIGGGFAVIGSAIGQVITWVGDFVNFTHQVVAAAPWLPKLIGYFTVISTVGLTVAATCMGIAAAIAGVAAAIAFVGAEALAVGALISVAMLPLLLLAGAAAVALGLSFKAAADVTESGWEGPLSIFEKMKLIFGGLSELIESYNGATGNMSLETAAKLKKAGLLDFVTDVFMAYHRLEVMWNAFKEGLDRASETLGPIVIPLIHEMGEAFFELTDALGLTDKATRMAHTSSSDWVDTGFEIAEVVVKMTAKFLEFTRSVVAGVRTMMPSLNLLVSGISAIYNHDAKSIKAFAMNAMTWSTDTKAAYDAAQADKAKGDADSEGMIDKLGKARAEREAKQRAVPFSTGQLQNLGLPAGPWSEDVMSAFQADQYQKAGTDYNEVRKLKERANTKSGVPLEASPQFAAASAGPAAPYTGPGSPLWVPPDNAAIVAAQQAAANQIVNAINSLRMTTTVTNAGTDVSVAGVPSG